MKHRIQRLRREDSVAVENEDFLYKKRKAKRRVQTVQVAE